jgi:tRNA pseudouridine55 synthase
MDGFLNLKKPTGFTSHDCVATVRRLMKLKRVGHAGTLDPAASGVLPIALGKATRLLQFLPQDKVYQATVRFGVRTTTDDLEGEAVKQEPVPALDLETVKAALPQFLGEIQQVPPVYSAIQVKGKRLYDLARSGREVAVPPRLVQVYDIRVLSWRPGAFPEIDLMIACGPGTYIRAIARDLGKSLQTGGTLAVLLRTKSSGFQLSDSLTLEDLETQLQQQSFRPVVPEVALAHLPILALPPAIARRWCQGQRIVVTSEASSLPSDTLRVHDSGGTFLGVGQTRDDDGEIILAPKVVFLPHE